ncbi:hypothetical protein [Nostoc sp.]
MSLKKWSDVCGERSLTLHPTKKQAAHSIDYRRKVELNFLKILKAR